MLRLKALLLLALGGLGMVANGAVLETSFGINTYPGPMELPAGPPELPGMDMNAGFQTMGIGGYGGYGYGGVGGFGYGAALGGYGLGGAKGVPITTAGAIITTIPAGGKGGIGGFGGHGGHGGGIGAFGGPGKHGPPGLGAFGGGKKGGGRVVGTIVELPTVVQQVIPGVPVGTKKGGGGGLGFGYGGLGYGGIH